MQLAPRPIAQLHSLREPLPHYAVAAPQSADLPFSTLGRPDNLWDNPPPGSVDMPTQSQALRLMLEAIRAMRAAGYTQEDVQELVTAAFQHLEGKPSPALRLRPLPSTTTTSSSGWRSTSGASSCANPAPGTASPGVPYESITTDHISPRETRDMTS